MMSSDILDADRQPHDVGTCAGELQLLGRKLAVRGRRRMDDERARVADICEMRQKFHLRHDPHSCLASALEAEGEDGAGARWGSISC